MFRVHRGTHAQRAHSPGPMVKRQSATFTPALEQLKQEVRNTSHTDNPVPALRQLRQSALYDDVWNACKGPAPGSSGQAVAHHRQQAKAAAEAYTTCHALDAVIKLSEGYDLRLVARSTSKPATEIATPAHGRQFLEQMHPAHRAKLIDDFRESWQKNSGIRQAAIQSALSAEARAQTGLPRNKMRNWGDIPTDRLLNTAELLALVDYVNSNTGTFNAVNSAAMVEAYYGDEVLSGLMKLFSGVLGSAIAKLCAHPYFGKTDIVAYKGIKLMNQSGQFRLGALEAAVGSGRIIAFPNVLSATSDPEKSYAVDKYIHGYTIEFQLRMPRAFDADPFHDVMTMGEKEVIGPAGQRFVVVGKQAIEVFQMASGRNEEVTRFLLEPAPLPPR